MSKIKLSERLRNKILSVCSQIKFEDYGEGIHMETLLSELYRGEINPTEYVGINDKKGIQAKENFDSFYEEFRSSLNKEHREQLEKLLDYGLVVNDRWCENFFKAGVSICISLVFEAIKLDTIESLIKEVNS